MISEQTADAAIAYLSLYGIQLDELFPGVDDPKEKLVELVVELTKGAIEICKGDYKKAINDTINFVHQWLKANNVSY